MSVYWMVTKLCHFDTLRALFAWQQSNVVYLSEIIATSLTFHNQTADTTYCADHDVPTLFMLRRLAGCHWLQHCFSANFLRFIALNAIWAHFLGAKLRFHPILYPLNMLNKTKLTRNGRKKVLRVEEQVEAWLSSIKETETLIFFWQCKKIIYFSWTPKLVLPSSSSSYPF